jgi:hypothetical protein
LLFLRKYLEGIYFDSFFSYSESACAFLASIMLHEITAHVALQVDGTCSLSPATGRSWSLGFMRHS